MRRRPRLFAARPKYYTFGSLRASPTYPSLQAASAVRYGRQSDAGGAARNSGQYITQCFPPQASILPQLRRFLLLIYLQGQGGTFCNRKPCI